MEKTYEQFIAEYEPIVNQLVDNAAHEGTMFETYGEEEAYVTRVNQNKVWSIMDGGSEGMYITNGKHYVNRIGYFVTHKAWEGKRGTIEFTL